MLDSTFTPALVIHTGTGDVHLEDILATMRRWFADPQFDPKKPVLWDLRNAAIDTTPDDLTRWAESMLEATNDNRAGEKTAWVLPTSDVARMAVDLLSSYDFRNKVRIYQNDIEAAEAWLTTTIT
jgi:hypothetical protein